MIDVQVKVAVCKACSNQVKDWKGSDPECAFINGAFSPDNFCCATARLIRTLCQETDSSGIHWRQTFTYQEYATIDLSEGDIVEREDEEGNMISQPICLWAGWYKSRGRTEGMWLMFEDLPPRPPTEEECVKILEYYNVAMPKGDAGE